MLREFNSEFTSKLDNMEGVSLIPDGEVLADAKRSCLYALVTGHKDLDYNRAGTMEVFDQGYRKDMRTECALPPCVGVLRFFRFLRGSHRRLSDYSILGARSRWAYIPDSQP